MTTYDLEAVDRLPFGSPERARRYRTERYPGAVGLNWYRCDPTLQFMMRYYLSAEQLAWVEPHLERLGALMGGPVAARAEETDKHPPYLERYDRWGHDISRVVMPASFEASKADLLEHRFSSAGLAADATAVGVDARVPAAAYSYLLDQAEIGMACALGTGGEMVERLVREFAPPDIKARVLPRLESGEWAGETAQLLTERTGGSDLAELETTATPVGDGDAWVLNGLKWFASNANCQAYVVLAKPLGAPDTSRGIATFLVLRERRDGSANGVRIRRLKDKLGTKAVASAEVEFCDAEAFLLGAAPDATDAAGDSGAGDGRGLSRMMEMTNAARIGVAMMGLGCGRRALVESLCYASARTAFGADLIDQPLMQRKLAEMIVDVEAVQALVFEGFGLKNHPQSRPAPVRLGVPVIKLKAARLGITAASDAVEIHGGNGYVETWPVARILRDAQVNTIWEGPDNILCLDVRRAIEREHADEAFFERLHEAVGSSESAIPGNPTAAVVSQAIADLTSALEAWRHLDRRVGEARLYPLAQFMADVYAGALLVEQAAWEASELAGGRKALIARLYARRHLGERGRLRGIDSPDAEDLERFKELRDGAFVDDRVA